jgi:chitodextrinase
VTGYDLLQNGSKIGTTTSANYTFNALACGTSYTFAVDAFDAVGQISGQAALIAATSPCSGATPPTTPTGLAVTGATQSSLSLSWNASADNLGIAGYDVFQSGSKVGRVSGLSYTFNGLACGTSYTLGVDAIDAAGSTSGQAAVAASTRPCNGTVAYYVSPAGSDSNPGTYDQPWRTIKKAMATLTAGQTAYLRAGTYKEELSGSCGLQYNKLVWTTSGTSAAPITISGYPGEEKQVIVPTAIKLSGNYERLTNVIVDKNVGWSTFDNVCDGGPSVNVFGLNDTVSGVEIRNSAMSGLYLEGADGASIMGNWIHNNGTHWNLDHGIYWCSGANSVAADNIVQDNYANGIKVGPNAQSVLVTENTVEGNGRSGIIVSGDTTYKSNNNTIADNILTWNGVGTGGGYGLRTYWESAGVGTGNQAIRNLMYGNTTANLWIDGGGMSESGSIFQDPLFVNRAAGDFHVLTGSPAVDSANSSYAVSRAFDGTLRPQGAAPDLGAYER